jgi:hypothetical protein
VLAFLAGDGTSSICFAEQGAGIEWIFGRCA